MLRCQLEQKHANLLAQYAPSATLVQIYTYTVNGCAASLASAQAEVLAALPQVTAINQDVKKPTQDSLFETNLARIYANRISQIHDPTDRLVESNAGLFVVGHRQRTTDHGRLHCKPMATAASTVPPDSLGMAHLICAYKVNGHLAVNLDPLGFHSHKNFPLRPKINNNDGWGND
ncbi:hypothetical protein ACA910_003089 [Epithemia clementina (nom. ined.)]